MRQNLGQLVLEGALVVGAAYGQLPLFLAHLAPLSSFVRRSLNESGRGSSTTES
jgi:hypothetical protein